MIVKGGLDRCELLSRLLDELERGLLVPGFREETYENLAVLVDRTPQLMHLATDLHLHLVKVPVPMAKALHPRHPLSADG
jgi:hypothetical protein